jgi:hypothetical protein
MLAVLGDAKGRPGEQGSSRRAGPKSTIIAVIAVGRARSWSREGEPAGVVWSSSRPNFQAISAHLLE